jgi:hypothetical protein
MKLSKININKRIAEIEGAVRTSVSINDVTKEESLIAYFTLGEGFSHQQPIAQYGYNPLDSERDCWILMIKHHFIVLMNEDGLYFSRPECADYSTEDKLNWFTHIVDSSISSCPRMALLLGLITSKTPPKQK